MKTVEKKVIKYKIVEPENEKEKQEIKELIEAAKNEKIDLLQLKKIINAKFDLLIFYHKFLIISNI